MNIKKKTHFLCATAVLFSLVFSQSGLRADIDEGYVANTPWSGYWWPIKTGELLGPLKKYDQVTGSRAADWERNENPPGENVPEWYGYCHGWSASSILEKEPKSPITVSNKTFSVGDQKGLLAASHAYDLANSYGKRFQGAEDDDMNDIAPDELWMELRRHLKEQRIALIFDTDPGPMVWNFPVYAYRVTYNPADGKTCSCILEVWFVGDSVPKDFVGLQKLYKKYTFDAKFKNGSVVLGTGQWTGASKNDHPDFVWFPYVARPQNPELNYKLVCEILGTTPAEGGNGEMVAVNPPTLSETPTDQDNAGQSTQTAQTVQVTQTEPSQQNQTTQTEETSIAQSDKPDKPVQTEPAQQTQMTQTGETYVAQVDELDKPVQNEPETPAVSITTEELTALTKGKKSSWEFDITVDRFDGGEYVQGEGIVVSGKSQEAGYLYLIAIDPNRELSLIYPSGKTDNRIEADTVFTVPAGDSGEKFYLTGPVGDYRIHAVVCENRLDANSNVTNQIEKEKEGSLQLGRFAQDMVTFAIDPPAKNDTIQQKQK